MKVQELRNLLKDAERENLEKAFVECYKQLRKGQKEEGDYALLRTPAGGLDGSERAVAGSI